jgi:hypothetical protein
MKEEMPDILNKTLTEAVEKLKATQKDITIKNEAKDEYEYLPIKVLTEPSPNPKESILKVETVIGRGWWLFGIKHILTNTIKILYKHKWSIMVAAPGVEWITSDDPVIRLNYSGKDNYNFGGGWGYYGSEILLPLSPKHILYTKVGDKNLQDLTFVNKEVSMELFDIIAKHSHRYIFAHKPIEDIHNIRPRTVDPIAFNTETEAWERWHLEQSLAEEEYKNKKKRTNGV